MDELPSMEHYRLPDHLGWRMIGGLVVIAVLSFASTHIASTIFGLEPIVASLVRVPVMFATGWLLGRWAFRSPITFRQAVRIIRRGWR